MEFKDMTIKLRERFCKDTNIPINIFIEPYFSERLEYLDKVLPQKHYKEKWLNYLEMLKDFNNEQDYFEYYNNIKDQAIQFIKNSQGYQDFNNEDMNQYKCNIGEIHKNLVKSIYQDQFVNGRTYVSIDICKANFSALNNYSYNIFGNNYTWEKFLGQFSKYHHILDSKYIRQVVLGNCNPGRVITYENYLAYKICEQVEKVIPNAKLLCFTTDELIFDIPNQEDRVRLYTMDTYPIHTKFEIFKLDKIDGDFQGYRRTIYDLSGNKIETEYKGLEGNFAYLIIKTLLDKDKITDNDLVFEFEKKHYCKLLKPIKIDIVEV